jgi:hypothetical protein
VSEVPNSRFDDYRGGGSSSGGGRNYDSPRDRYDRPTSTI